MPIDPAAVRAQQFRVVFRGYAVDEVDDFLDRIEEELARLSGRPSPDGEAPSGGPASSRLHLVPAHASPEPADAGEPETVEFSAAPSPVLRTLGLAERMAQQLIAEATAEAAAIRSRAQAEAAAILNDARAEAAHLVGATHLRLQQEIDHLAASGQRLWAELDRLAAPRPALVAASSRPAESRTDTTVVRRVATTLPPPRPLPAGR